jgi:hypothetical protein
MTTPGFPVRDKRGLKKRTIIIKTKKPQGFRKLSAVFLLETWY